MPEFFTIPEGTKYLHVTVTGGGGGGQGSTRTTWWEQWWQAYTWRWFKLKMALRDEIEEWT